MHIDIPLSPLYFNYLTVHSQPGPASASAGADAGRGQGETADVSIIQTMV